MRFRGSACGAYWESSVPHIRCLKCQRDVETTDPLQRYCGGTRCGTEPATKVRTYALPYPPSVNHYWRNVKGKTLISTAGRKYRDNVAACVQRVTPLMGRLKVFVMMFPPDRKRRDCDNVLKSLLDSLQKAGVYGDDSQIDDLRIVRMEKVDGGKVVVQVEEL